MGSCVSIFSSRHLEINSILRNHLIVEKVSEYLSMEDLKNCRAVNKEWKSIFNSSFMEISRVKIHLTYENYNDMIPYMMTKQSNQAHVNCKIIIKDYPLFKKPVEDFCKFLNNHSGLKDVIIDLDVRNRETCEEIATKWQKLEPQKSMENLQFHSTCSTKCFDDEIELSLVARAFMQLFPNVSFLQFYSKNQMETFSSVFLEEILKTPDAFNNLTSAQFKLTEEHPYNIKSVYLLAQLPFKLKKLDLGFISPQTNDVAKALENSLAQHAESLENFTVGIGNAKKQFVVNFPTMNKLQVLDVFHIKTKRTIDKNYATMERGELNSTKLHLAFNFGESTFIQKMPILQKLLLKNEFIGTDPFDDIAQRPSTELLECFFGKWPEDEICEKNINIEIGNVWADSKFFMKVRQALPNAKIFKTNF